MSLNWLEKIGSVEMAFQDALDNTRRYDSNATVTGVLVQKLAEKPLIEVIVGGMKSRLILHWQVTGVIHRLTKLRLVMYCAMSQRW